MAENQIAKVVGERTMPGLLVEKWRTPRRIDIYDDLAVRHRCADELSASLSGVRAQLQGVMARICELSERLKDDDQVALGIWLDEKEADTLTTIAAQLGGEK